MSSPMDPQEVIAPVFCSLTRFGLRSPRHIRSMRRDFSAIVEHAKHAQVPGLLQSAFLVQSPAACFSMSIWDRMPILSAFVPEHIAVANRVNRKLEIDQVTGPELWSTTWKLHSVSNNLQWAGFDLDKIARGEGS